MAAALLALLAAAVAMAPAVALVRDATSCGSPPAGTEWRLVMAQGGFGWSDPDGADAAATHYENRAVLEDAAATDDGYSYLFCQKWPQVTVGGTTTLNDFNTWKQQEDPFETLHYPGTVQWEFVAGNHPYGGTADSYLGAAFNGLCQSDRSKYDVVLDGNCGNDFYMYAIGSAIAGAVPAHSLDQTAGGLGQVELWVAVRTVCASHSHCDADHQCQSGICVPAPTPEECAAAIAVADPASGGARWIETDGKLYLVTPTATDGRRFVVGGVSLWEVTDAPHQRPWGALAC